MANRKQTKQTNESVVYVADIKHGYNGFSLYFPKAGNYNISELLKHIKIFEDYISRNLNLYDFGNIITEKAFYVDLYLLKGDQNFIHDWPNFSKEFIINAKEILNIFGLAMHQQIINNKIVDVAQLVPYIYPTIINNENEFSIKDVDIELYKKLITVKGIISKISSVKQFSKTIAFNCYSCGAIKVVKQKDSMLRKPKKCTVSCDENNSFIPLFNSPFTISQNLMNVNIIDIEGLENKNECNQIDCELREQMVKSYNLGDEIVVTGIVKIRKNDDKQKHVAKIMPVYLKGCSVRCLRNEESYGVPNYFFSDNDYAVVRAIHSKEDVFRLLVQSLCPKVFGHETVKAGLLLAMFGGTNDENYDRSECHVMIVGDPGLGKSHLLKACANASHKGVYVCGQTGTNGLTVRFPKDHSDIYNFEAGPLVLANNGVCCIDEFDRVSTEHAALLEVMEEQRIHVVKSGVSFDIPTKVSIFAATNPHEGNYSKSKTLIENVALPSSIVSKFDLVFVLLDKPNDQHDKLLTEHFGKHGRYGRKKKKISTQSPCNSALSTTINTTLGDRLQVLPGEMIDYVPHGLMKTYIAYAKKYVKVTLDNEAMRTIKEFYLELRKKLISSNCLQTTTSQMESLIRLTQARAKLELREVATEEDACDVVSIVKNSLIDIFIDNSEKINIVAPKSKSSSRGSASKYLALLQHDSKINKKKIYDSKELKQIGEEMGIFGETFIKTITALNEQGYILTKGQGKYEITNI